MIIEVNAHLIHLIHSKQVPLLYDTVLIAFFEDVGLACMTNINKLFEGHNFCSDRLQLCEVSANRHSNKLFSYFDFYMR